MELFGDPVTNEKGWPIVRLDSVADIRIGPFGSLLHKEDYIEGGHALVNPSHIIDGKIVPDQELTVSDEKYNLLSTYQLEKGDVVLLSYHVPEKRARRQKKLYGKLLFKGRKSR